MASILETLPWPVLKRLCSVLPSQSLVILAIASPALEIILEEAGVYQDRIATDLKQVLEKIDLKVQELEVKERKLIYHNSIALWETSDPPISDAYYRVLLSDMEDKKRIKKDILHMVEVSADAPGMVQLDQLLCWGHVDF